jgi:serine/threonine protein kinase
MELMPGRTLQDELKEVGKLSVQRAVDVAIDVIDGLLAAHNLGVVHRDVKPTNCFVGADGRVKIGDFGLSKSLKLDTERTRAGSRASSRREGRLPFGHLFPGRNVVRPVGGTPAIRW